MKMGEDFYVEEKENFTAITDYSLFFYTRAIRLTPIECTDKKHKRFKVFSYN